MLSLLRLRFSGSICTIYMTNVKCAHRSSGGRQRRPQQQLWSGQGKENWENEMAEDVEEIEDVHNWFEANVAKPEFQKVVASEEEKLRKLILHKIIERKYYKKPQETNLLTWDAKEQIRFLHNEFPDEWTVERLAESFPTSREGIIKIVKSHFQPKSLAEIVKHDERVQKHWRQLQDRKTKSMLTGGPVTSRYQTLLKSAAGNPSLPMPDLNRLLLPSGRNEREPVRTGTFLSIVKDYCEKKQGTTDTTVLQQVKSKKSDQLNVLEDHLSANRKLIEGVVETSPKKQLDRSRRPINGMFEQSPNHPSENRKQMKGTIEQTPNRFMVEQSPNQLKQNRKLVKGIVEKLPNRSEHPEGKNYTDLYRTLESKKQSFDAHLSRSGRQSLNRKMPPKQLIDSDFEFSLPENEEDESIDSVSVTPRRQSRSLDRHLVTGNQEANWVDDEGMQGTKKRGESNDSLRKMEENSRLGHKTGKSGSRHAVNSRFKEALHRMKDEDVEEGTETYMFSEEKGYQHPFGQRKDVPAKRISVPHNKLKSGVEFKTKNDYYDEDGEFLYRTP